MKDFAFKAYLTTTTTSHKVDPVIMAYKKAVVSGKKGQAAATLLIPPCFCTL